MNILKNNQKTKTSDILVTMTSHLGFAIAATWVTNPLWAAGCLAASLASAAYCVPKMRAYMGHSPITKEFSNKQKSQLTSLMTTWCALVLGVSSGISFLHFGPIASIATFATAKSLTMNALALDFMKFTTIASSITAIGETVRRLASYGRAPGAG